MGLLVLLLLDPGQHFDETLVLDDGRVADALQMVEDGVGQGQSLPADLQPAIGKVIDVDYLAGQCRRCLIGTQHELHGVVIYYQMSRDRTLFAPAQGVVEIVGYCARPMQVPLARWRLGKTGIVFAASMVLIPASRSSFTNRSCSV